MNVPREKNRLWASLAEEADRTATRRPISPNVLKPNRRFQLIDRLGTLWLSGFLPLALICLCFSKGYLTVLAPCLALLLMPLASGKSGLTPTRLLFLCIPAMIVVPKYLLSFGWLGDIDPRSPVRNLYSLITYQEVFSALGWVGLSCLATYFIRKRLPWYEPLPYGKLTKLLCLLFIGFPLFLLGSELAMPSETAESRAWQREVLSREPYLTQRRILHFRDSEWERVYWEARSLGLIADNENSTPIAELSQVQISHVGEFEKRILPLISNELLKDTNSDTSATATEVLTSLISYPTALENPVQLYATAEKLTMLGGEPPVLTEPLGKYLRERVQKTEQPIRTLREELEILRELMELCPSHVVLNDRRWYSANPDLVYRRRVDVFLDLDNLKDRFQRYQVQQWWLTVRPHLKNGKTLEELEKSPERSTSIAANRLLTRDANKNHAALAKPTWESLIALYESKIQMQERARTLR